MIRPIDTKQSTQRKNFVFAKFWGTFLIFATLVIVTGSWVMPASSSDLPDNKNVQVQQNITPTATPTATRTNRPTLTKTPPSSATQATTVSVSAVHVYLRTGPSLNFSGIQRLAQGDKLTLLGRSSDDTWLFVKTADGQAGWIEIRWVDLTGINLDDNGYPVKTPSPPPPVTISVTDGSVNLRTGPGPYYAFIRKLSYGDQLKLLGRLNDNNWLFVKTTNGEEGWLNKSSVDLSKINLNHVDYPFKEAPPTETATLTVLTDIEGRWIDVDLSEQMVRAFEGTELVASFLVSTGVNKYPTETGRYKVYVKYESSLMHGPDYYLPDVPFSMYYSGEFSIHGTYWHHNFGTPMSHGCINMSISDAEWLYNWADIGTIVNIHR